MDEKRRSKLLNELDDMTMSHKQNVMQIAAFQTNTDIVYGINIAKIKEFAMIKDAQVTAGLSDNPYQQGIAVLRGDSFPVINLNKWLGGEATDSPDLSGFDIFIVCEFNQSLIAFPVKKILMIASKGSEDLERPSTTDQKVTYITKIELNKDRRRRRRKKRRRREKEELKLQSMQKKPEEEEICFVLDVEQMLEDIFPGVTAKKLDEMEQVEDIKPINSDKLLVICEDSPVATDILKKTLLKTNLDIHYFGNGMEFKAWVLKNPAVQERIGCVLTDIEMPLMDGFKVVDFVKNEFNISVPIIVNTSMSNIGVIKKLENMGVEIFIPKTEPLKIYRALKELMEVGNV